MAKEVQLSGTAQVRPVRLGIFFPANQENLQLAIGLCSLSWGGKYNFLIPDTTTEEQVKHWATYYNLDCIVPLDFSLHRRATLADLRGLRWRELADHGPFGKNPEHYDTSVLTVEWTLPRSSGSPFAYRPNREDALHNLICATHGTLPDNPNHEHLQELYRHYRIVEYAPDDQVYQFPLDMSSIDYTTTHTTNSISDQVVAIIILDPQAVDQVMTFWNLRASGANVFAWPIIEYSRIEGQLRSWLSGEEDGLNHISREHIWTVNLSNNASQARNRLEQILSEFESNATEASPRDFEQFQVVRPISSTFTTDFRVSGIDQNGSIPIPLPRLMEGRNDLRTQQGMVAVDLQLESSANVPVGFTFDVPNIRELALPMLLMSSPLEIFRRPCPRGQSIGLSVSKREVEVTLIRTIDAFSELLRDSNTSVSQSDSGVFAAHMIDKLGGEGSTVANQPGYRAVLQCASRAPMGTKIARLINEAKKYRGKWPSYDFRVDEYPKNVVYELLAKKILLPHFSIKCPRCTNETGIRPSDLDFERTCDFCGFTHPFGLALGLHQNSDWVYRISGNMPTDRLAETLPIMAALNTLQSFKLDSGSISSASVLGLKYKSSNLTCEIDIATFLTFNYFPVLVIGEVKSYRDPISRKDVENLLSVQRDFLTRGIAVRIMLATLRESFEPDELADIRDALGRLEMIPHPIGHNQPNLPIIFTANDLSVDALDKDHPGHWGGPGTSLEFIARESCKRNLGLRRITKSSTNPIICTMEFE